MSYKPYHHNAKAEQGSSTANTAERSVDVLDVLHTVQRTMPPMANRGGTEKVTEAPNAENFEYYTQVIINERGQTVSIPLKRGLSDAGFIDQISFTFHESTLKSFQSTTLVADEEYILCASAHLEHIFGFGIWKQTEGSGGRFYKTCWLMGTENALYGKVHYGGQKGTMHVALTATGCMAAKEGWEKRLFTFLALAVRGKITRIDVAHDFLNGEYTPEKAYKQWNKGKFSLTNRKPKLETRGTDWHDPKGTSGKTLYIGSRESSKYLRVYEKGKAFGDKSSPWVRAEVEFKANDIFIPFDALLFPGNFLSGAYPAFEHLSKAPARIEVIKKEFDLSIEKSIFYAKQQAGRVINLMSQLDEYASASDILNALKAPFDALPKRLAPDVYSAEFNDIEPVHRSDYFENKKFDEFGMK